MRLPLLLGALAAATAAGSACTPAMAQRGPTPVVARPPQPACLQVQPGSQAYAPIRMQLAAEHAESDPARVWSNWDLWNPNSPQRTAIWTGTASVCGGGEVVVSQIVNRQCSSSVECPARVLYRRPDGDRVLLGYQQLCTLRATFELQGDLRSLRACGVPVALMAD